MLNFFLLKNKMLKYWCLVSEKITTWKQGLCRCDQIKMRWWIKVAPTKMPDVLTRIQRYKEEKNHVKIDAQWRWPITGSYRTVYISPSDQKLIFIKRIISGQNTKYWLSVPGRPPTAWKITKIMTIPTTSSRTWKTFHCKSVWELARRRAQWNPKRSNALTHAEKTWTPHVLPSSARADTSSQKVMQGLQVTFPHIPHRRDQFSQELKCGHLGCVPEPPTHTHKQKKRRSLQLVLLGRGRISSQGSSPRTGTLNLFPPRSGRIGACSLMRLSKCPKSVWIRLPFPAITALTRVCRSTQSTFSKFLPLAWVLISNTPGTSPHICASLQSQGPGGNNVALFSEPLWGVLSCLWSKSYC